MLNKGRILVLVLACLVVSGVIFQSYTFDERLAMDNAIAGEGLQEIRVTEAALATAKQSQAAYLAIGQSSSYWMAHFDEALTQVESSLQARQRATQSDRALAQYDTALEQIAALRTSDQRARNYVGNDQLILASDVIFAESLEIIGRIDASIAAARDAEVAAASQSEFTITRYRQGLGLGGLVFILIVAFLVSRRPQSAVEAEAPLTLNLAPTPVPVPTPALVTITPELDETADVCVDLARLLDGRDLPALLGRAADAIDARGLVLWVVDESGRTLRASLGHGYPDRMLARLGQLSVTADNVTSLAYRSLQPQLVPGATDGAGALAVPLVGPSGCVGVLAAEVVGARATSHQVAVARLIAAQLAAVIRPDAATSASSAAQ